MTRLTDEEFAARLAKTLRTETLTLLFDEDKTQADHLLDLIEEAMLPTQVPLAVSISASGTTASFALLTEDPKTFSHHNAFLNNKTALFYHDRAVKAGRKTRILRGKK